MLGEMLASIGPRREALSAESAPASYFSSFRLPTVHLGYEFAAVNQPQVLCQVILAVKCAPAYRLVAAFADIVDIKVSASGLVCPQ